MPSPQEYLAIFTKSLYHIKKFNSHWLGLKIFQYYVCQWIKKEEKRKKEEEAAEEEMEFLPLKCVGLMSLAAHTYIPYEIKQSALISSTIN